MNLALKGTLKEYRGELPEWLTAEKTFEIYLQLIKSTWVGRGSSDEGAGQHLLGNHPNQPIHYQIVKPLIVDALSRRNVSSKTNQSERLLEAEGLNFCDEHGQKILQAAVEKYFSTDDKFKEKVVSVKRHF